MTKKQEIIIIIFAVVVLGGIVIGASVKKGGVPVLPGGPLGNSPSVSDGNGNNILPGQSTFTSEVPKNAALTIPKNEAPASANPELNTKIKFFDLRASRNGFSPSSITVNKGDSLSVDFTAADGDYDLDIPYLGAYFSAVGKGVTKKLLFDTSLPGTFIFQCRDHCPSTGKIQGSLIVLP